MNRWIKSLALVGMAFAICTVPSLKAQTLTALHNFTGGADGSDPAAGLAQDSAGNLYGTTQEGGNGPCVVNSSRVGCGVVFKMSREGSGWVFRTLYEFGGPPDGEYPLARVIVGPDGALYGTTSQGGAGSCLGQQGCGTVFKLQPPASFCRSFSCPWTETILYSFSSRNDGFNLTGEVAFDHSGNLYGTTANGGGGANCFDDGCGTVFELTPNGNGTWTKGTIYAFQGGTMDGNQPAAGVVVDQSDNLYGTTTYGGSTCESDGCGIVFQLTPHGSSWTETVLHSFQYTDGAAPGQLSFDSSGNLWGPAADGGNNYGTIFELTPLEGGGWHFVSQYSFNYGQAEYPTTLTIDPAGDIYGCTGRGGHNDGGEIFSLTPSSGGLNYTTLYSFGFGQSDYPVGKVVLDSEGNIYGTTLHGADPPYGTVWEFTP